MKAKKNKRERSEQMRQVSAGLRDVLGMTQWRKEHPKATWAEIEAAVDERMNQLRAQLIQARGGTSEVCDLRQAAFRARRADTLHPNDGRGSGQVDAHVWHLPCLWGRLFSP